MKKGSLNGTGALFHHPTRGVIRFVIADDLSGAADSAVHFRGSGRVRLNLLHSAPWTADTNGLIQVCDSETRNLAPSLAGSRVRSIAARLAERTGPRPALFKKVDSTLRGNAGVELLAAADELGFAAVIVAPGLPSQGRTVEDGQLLVHGIPVSRTAAGVDPLQPVKSDMVRDILGCPVQSVRLPQLRGGGDFLAGASHGLVVVDSNDDADLEVLAAALSNRPDLLPAGSAGLARAIAARHPPGPSIEPPRAASIAVLVGSGSPIARDQLARLREARLDSVRIFEVADPGGGDSSRMVRELAARAVSSLPALEPPVALLATGGDTALALCQALEEDAIWACGELLPGIPWGTLDRSGTTLATKAGGFGGPDALLESVLRLLRRAPEGLAG